MLVLQLEAADPNGVSIYVSGKLIGRVVVSRIGTAQGWSPHGRVKLGFDFPREFKILREELGKPLDAGANVG